MRIWGGDCIEITGILHRYFVHRSAPYPVANNLAHLIIRELARLAIYPYLQVMLINRDVWFATIPRDITRMMLPMLPTGDMFAGFPHNFLPPVSRGGGIVEHMELGAPHTGMNVQMTYDYFGEFATRYSHGEQTYCKYKGIIITCGETYYRNGYIHGWSTIEQQEGRTIRNLHFMGTLLAMVDGGTVTYYRTRMGMAVASETVVEGEFDSASVRALCF